MNGEVRERSRLICSRKYTPVNSVSTILSLIVSKNFETLATFKGGIRYKEGEGGYILPVVKNNIRLPNEFWINIYKLYATIISRIPLQERVIPTLKKEIEK